MDELGLNPGSLSDCQAYDAYLMAVEDEAIGVELARMDAEEARTDLEDQVRLSRPPPAKLLPLPLPNVHAWTVRRSPRSRRSRSSRQARAPTRPQPRRSRRAAA
jgi:hypothetical protein